MAVNGRNKGANFERVIAKQLSEWCGFTITRTPSSGGWAKTGDITPKDPKEMVKFIFGVECKNNESWNFPLLFKGRERGELNSVFSQWWKQCTDDCKISKKIPIVVFTRNNDPVFCIMRSTEFRMLNKVSRIIDYIKIGSFRIFLWEDLLRIPYKKVVKILTK